ncbi:MAG: hypothetical protein LBR58_07265 [Propionibacteriaceae bacterium]|jgi:uncharacterized protein YukE|nr:hypothetical protein [Propionibacteriaceae bacterium]
MAAHDQRVLEGALEKAAGLLEQGEADIKQLASNGAGLATGHSQSWIGAGGEAARRLIQRWQDKMNQVAALYEPIIDNVRQTERNKVQIEQEQESALAQFAAGLE